MDRGTADEWWQTSGGFCLASVAQLFLWPLLGRHLNARSLRDQSKSKSNYRCSWVSLCESWAFVLGQPIACLKAREFSLSEPITLLPHTVRLRRLRDACLPANDTIGHFCNSHVNEIARRRPPFQDWDAADSWIIMVNIGYNGRSWPEQYCSCDNYNQL